MDLLGREMLRDEPGQQALLDRLLDVALVQVLREHFTARDAARAGLVSRAPATPTSAPRCARCTPTRRASGRSPTWPPRRRLSRSAFARRFTELLGEAPLTYLTQWRMALARERLRDSDQRLAAIAQSLGYGSEFAFAAAFKRHHGAAPGRWRAARARPRNPQVRRSRAAQS